MTAGNIYIENGPGRVCNGFGRAISCWKRAGPKRGRARLFRPVQTSDIYLSLMVSNCTGERSFSQVMPEAPEDSTPVNHIARQAERLRVEEHCKLHIATKRDFTVIITEFASQKSRTTVHGVRLIRRQTVYCLKLYPRVVGLHTAQFSFTVQCN